jgi:hypothetical protein
MTTGGSLDDVDVGLVVVVCGGGGVGVVGTRRHTFSIHFLDYDLHSDPNLLLLVLLLVHTLVTLHPVAPPLYVACAPGVLLVSLVLIQRQRHRIARDHALILLFLLLSNGLSTMTSSGLDQRAASSWDRRRCEGSGCCGRGSGSGSGSGNGNRNGSELVHRVRRCRRRDGRDGVYSRFKVEVRTFALPSFGLVDLFQGVRSVEDR